MNTAKPKPSHKKPYVKLYLRSASLDLASKATRVFVYPDYQQTQQLTHSVSVMCERLHHFGAAYSTLQAIQPNLLMESAHHRLFTKFNSSSIPLAFICEERRPRHSKFNKVAEYAASKKPLICLYQGAPNPQPYEICETSVYLILDFTSNVILFSYSHSLNPLQLVILQYLLQNWSEFADSEHPLQILDAKKRIRIYNASLELGNSLTNFKQ